MRSRRSNVNANVATKLINNLASLSSGFSRTFGNEITGKFVGNVAIV